jgi:hypothetical protein
MDNYRMDRTVAAKLTFEEADDHVSYYKDKSYNERLNNACFIINHIFQVTPKTKLDRTITDKRKHDKSV